MGRNLINLFFPKDVYRRSLSFFLALRARSRALAKKKIRLSSFNYSKYREEREQKKTVSKYIGLEMSPYARHHQGL